MDAPSGGTPVQAKAGQLSAMVGCDEAIFEQINPVIASWATKSTCIGLVGSGHKMKLLMNFIGLNYGAPFFRSRGARQQDWNFSASDKRGDLAKPDGKWLLRNLHGPYR